MSENEIIASAVCPQCGAPLIAIDDKGTLKCEYCNTTALDARHSFTHVSRDFDSELEINLESAGTLIKNRFYEQAFSAYSSLVNTFGKDYRVWAGLIASITHNFTDYGVFSDVFIQAERYYETAKSTKNFSEESEFAVNYKKWRDEVIARNKQIQAYAEKCEKHRLIKNAVFFSSIPLFLFIYWFICFNLIAAEPLQNWVMDMLRYALAPAVYSTAVGIAAIITKFPSVSICLNIMTFGCVCIFFVGTGIANGSFSQFNLFWFIGTLLLTLVLYTISTILGRILGSIASIRR